MKLTGAHIFDLPILHLGRGWGEIYSHKIAVSRSPRKSIPNRVITGFQGDFCYARYYATKKFTNPNCIP